MLLPLTLLAASVLFPVPANTVKTELDGHHSAFVIIDCASKEVSRYNPEGCKEPLPPCSTFKIWNTAIGFEEGILTSPDQPFWKWDGKKRDITTWNQDLNLKDAFAASCVPAFQALARQTGKARMQEWLDKIGYGDRDISAGEDVFWLPDLDDPHRKTILISPDEQAQMICKLVNGELAFSQKTLAALKVIMTVKTTKHCTLYGKTGTGEMDAGKYDVAWFVGYVESNGKTFAFACVMKEPHIMGTNVRDTVERILSKDNLL